MHRHHSPIKQTLCMSLFQMQCKNDVVSTEIYLNCNINLPQSLHSIIAYSFYVETLYIFLDGEHHMFK